MKKLMIASHIAMAMAASSAMATVQQGSQGEVQFVGTVAAKTCDVIVSGDGAVNNQIQFGVVNVGGNEKKEFTIKLKDPTCIATPARAASSTAKFMWYSPALSEKGFKNQSGTATNAYVVLNAKDGADNTPTNSDVITDLNNAVDFNISLPEKGFVYEATLHAGDIPGSFGTAASYTIAYE
ncbi:TPA: hypothetical protein J5U03_002755 [Escherichia coli]|uniref:hypothetical protein n=1 Tax=Escherichia coli TaxID=562 RepID=UPI000BE42DD0|nr:hypothetical protein [Escherichia coli]EEW1616128.1 hypothetical protein [Escherichia coli]EEW1981607.1 hypothetical protein [Escherichia coli]EFB7435359.1 hypothetical protein [Escherichia coli]EFL7372906.1 hypothetical protein [Escherichia coli]EFL9858613.1 hypothetical protein [Escherichia coli]